MIQCRKIEKSIDLLPRFTWCSDFRHFSPNKWIWDGERVQCNVHTHSNIHIYMIEKWWHIDVFGGYLSCLPSNSSCCLCRCVSVWGSARIPINEHKNSIKSIISIWLDGCCSFLPQFFFWILFPLDKLS